MKPFLPILILWAIAAFTAPASAQEKTGEETSSSAIVIEARAEDDGSGTISNMQIMAVDATDLEGGAFFMTGDAMASGMPFGAINGMPMPFGGGDSFAMLNNPSVQKDLELVDDQIQQIKDVNADFSARIQDQVRELHRGNGSFDIARAKELGELVRKLKQQQKTEIDNLLLPHQQERLQQVALQMQMKAMGTARALASKLAEELDITDDQKDRLKQRQQELQEEMQQKISEMRENMQKELLQELTPQQRKKLKELTGAQFETKSEDFQPRRSSRAQIRDNGRGGQ